MTATSSSSFIPHFLLRCGIGYPSQGIIGSAYLEYGKSKVCVYVFTPRPMTKNANFDQGCLECEVSLAAHLLNQVEEVYSANHHPEGIAGVLSKLSRCAVDALTPAVRLTNYPKCTIMITAVLLDSSSDDQAALINCASAALCDAAVELRDVVAAFTVDTSLPSTQSNTPSHVYCELACLPSLNEITSVEVRGKCHPVYVMQLMEGMKEKCALIRTQIAQVLTAEN